MDRVLQVAPKKLREQLLQTRNIDFDKMMSKIATNEQTKDAEADVSKANLDKSLRSFENLQRLSQGYAFTQTQGTHVCRACNYTHRTNGICPAVGKTCGQCGLKNHFRAACHTPRHLWRKSNQNASGEFVSQKRSSDHFLAERPVPIKRFKSDYETRKNVHKIEDSQGSDLHMRTENVDMICGDNTDSHIYALVGDVKVKMEIDPGARSNVIDDKTWSFMQQSGANVVFHSKADKKFCAYASKEYLTTLGMFEAVIEIQYRGKILGDKATFYIVKDGPQSLLGKMTAVRLGVLKLGLPSNQIESTVNKMEEPGEFPKMKEIIVNVTVDPSVTTVIQPYRQVPFALLKKVDEKLDKVLKAGIIEPRKEPADWISQMVVIPKDSGTCGYVLTCEM